MPNYMLLVDDEHMILKSLKRELRTWAKERGLTVETAGSGEEALRFLERNYLETVLLMSDQKMPGLKGNELLETCSRKYPQIILLMLTGYTEINDIVKTVRTGVFSFILKPWDHDDLIYEVTKAFNVYEARRKNNEYLRLIKNETYLVKTLRDILEPTGEKDFDGYTVGFYSKTGKGENAFKSFLNYFSVAPGNTLLFLANISGDRVRASLLFSAVYFVVSNIIRDSENVVTLTTVMRGIENKIEELSAKIPEIIVQYTLGLLDVNEHTTEFFFSGNGTSFLLRGQGFAEISNDQTESRMKKIKMEPDDRVIIPTVGLFPGTEMDRDTKFFARGLLDAFNSENTRNLLESSVFRLENDDDFALVSIKRN